MLSKRNFVYKFSRLENFDLELLNKHYQELINIAGLKLEIPEGFLLSSNAYLLFLTENNLVKKIQDLLSTVHYERSDSLMQVSNHIKKLVISSVIPKDAEVKILEEYKALGGFFKSATVTIGESGHKANSSDLLIRQIKYAWASNFDPQNLLDAYKNKIDIADKLTALIIIKQTNYNKTGKLLLSDLSIKTAPKLSPAETKRIKLIGEKLKKHFYIPQIIEWGIKNKKTYILDITPMTNIKTSYLVLIRHGRSEYNEKGLWAGWDEPPLTDNGKEDVRIAAEALRDIHFDLAYTSHLIRHQQTIAVIKKTLKRKDLPVIINDALLERNYGDFTAKNKWDVEKQIGKDEFMKIRRSFDYPVPNGESLKQVYERVIPCYKNTLLPQLKSGKNIVIASSGNALRALVKYLENISDTDISKLEIATGEVYVYKIDEDGTVVGKEIRNQHENKV
ncbi:MAG TPA: 2,3-bisphosphoglycerate-dependent phosphoglycerate mutase [Candidatus Saccharimonadales bacterium]|nr:2,3-bisphosphoglycerate-dependent phosphoglycerate mutase [Candidatus Saccharimonadales bacterium]